VASTGRPRRSALNIAIAPKTSRWLVFAMRRPAR
jgi:hypothetical protein